MAHNLKRAETIIARASPVDLDLLILPEMAFSGSFHPRSPRQYHHLMTALESSHCVPLFEILQ
jgi:protein N-terminal amidase